MNDYNLGALDSPKDERDWVAGYIYSDKITLPQVVDYSSDFKTILNQGSYGTCAANVATNIKRWQEYKDTFKGKEMRDFSVFYVYNNRENINSEGMYGRDVMKILQKKGDCFDSSFPYLPENYNKTPNDKADTEARKFLVKNYAQCYTLDEVKKALYLNGPCYISVPVYNYGPKMWEQKGEGTYQGGHAMTLVGFNDVKKHLIIMNSWGPDWNEKGFCFLPYEDFGKHREVWTLIDEKSNYEDRFYYIKLIWSKIQSFWKTHKISIVVISAMIASFVGFLILGNKSPKKIK